MPTINNCLQVTVTVKGKKVDNSGVAGDFSSASNNSGNNSNNRGELHEGVTCDSCESDVRGFRYKCAICPDYDLCGDCEARGVHPGHNMVRISSPESAWPHHFFRRLSKMQERAHRRAHSAAAAAAAAGHRAAHAQGAAAAAASAASAAGDGEGGAGGSFYQSAFDPFLNGGQWVHGMRGGGGCGGRGRMRGRGFGRCSGRGGKMWEAMMKGWMGEDEMKERRDSKYGPEEGKEKKKEEEKKVEEGQEAQEQEATSPFEEIMKNIATGGGAEYLRNVGNLVAAALDPLGVDVQVDIEHNGQRSNISKPDKEKEDEEGAEAKQEQKEETKEAEEVKEAKEDEKSEETSEETSEESARAQSPPSDKESLEGEWTVLNKSREDGEGEKLINIPVQVVEDAKSKVYDANDGIRVVPINVSDQPADVLYGSPDGTLYPELPKQETTTVQENEEEKKEEEPKGEKEKPKEKEEPEPFSPSAPKASSVEHPDPKIQVALQAMMNMGFSNDGGWLTQLLESKNGDIGKVLDVLQPVRPVRK